MKLNSGPLCIILGSSVLILWECYIGYLSSSQKMSMRTLNMFAWTPSLLTQTLLLIFFTSDNPKKSNSKKLMLTALAAHALGDLSMREYSVLNIFFLIAATLC